MPYQRRVCCAVCRCRSVQYSAVAVGELLHRAIQIAHDQHPRLSACRRWRGLAVGLGEGSVSRSRRTLRRSAGTGGCRVPVISGGGIGTGKMPKAGSSTAP